MPRMLSEEDKLKFFTSRKVFTTTEARKAGIDKSALKERNDLVCFGAFPVKQDKGMRIENIWTHDKELAELATQAKKIKKTGTNADEITQLVSKIENMVREKLGFAVSVATPNIPPVITETVKESDHV